MGQKSSKRQSYTPGGTQDAGLPTAALTENGDLRTRGANGQVRLISNRESQYGDVITSDVTSTSSPEVAAEASSSPVSTEKKKRKTPRFVFSLKRTGSGKRSKRGRKKEANGVRPTSYPPPPSSADQAAGSRAADRDRKAQSMFVESVADQLQDDVIQASLSADDVRTAEEVTIAPSPAKKISTDSSASSSSKGHKDRKKNGSHKHKSSKKKDKEPKKKSKKKKTEEPDKAKTEEEEEEDDQTTAGVTATAEETTAAAEAVAAALTAAAAAKEEEEEEEPVKMEEMVVVKSDTTTLKEQEPAVETTTAPEDAERRTDLTLEAPKEDKEEETRPPQPSHTEEPVEETLALTVAAVSEAEVKVSLLDDSPEDALDEDAEEEPAMTAEQLVAEIEQTILSKEHSGLLQHSFQTKLTQAEQAPPEEQQEQSAQAQASLLVAPGGEENVELAGQVIHEDILELSDISSPVTDNVEQQGSGQAEKEEEEADRGSLQVDRHSADVEEQEEEVMKQTVTAEVQSAVEAVREEAVVDTVLQQQVEELVECSPSAGAVIQTHEEQAQGGTEPAQHKPQQSTEVPQSPAQAPEDGMTAASAPESAANPAPQPIQDTLQPLTPAQLRALEKELKANKKKEEKERARREKEEKKRLKDEKKREAKEKKRKEKEEKERRLREAKEKVKAAANATVEVRAEEEAVEEAVRASHSSAAQSAPDTSASGHSQLQQQQQLQQIIVVDPQPSTSAEDGGKGIQLSVGAPTDDLPVPSSSATPADLTPGQTKPEEQLLGSSVKEIISSIENTADGEPKTLDESSPPEVPDTPYPEEDVLAQSSAVSQFSPPSPPGSPDSSGPSSPAAVEDSSASETTLESPSAIQTSTCPLEVSETARSSVLRRIELGPRLRTAILRKSSSGAESEDKRVSLTQPRHVQVSDLTPPPRKPRPRRTLEHTRDSSGNYCYSSSSLTPTPGKEQEPVIEEHVGVEASAASESSPDSPQEQGGEGEEDTGTTSRAAEMPEVEEEEEEQELTAAVSSSVSQPLQLSSSPSPQTADSPGGKPADCQEDEVQVCQQLKENVAPSGSELSEPERSALAAVASIVHAGQRGSPDTQQVQAGQGAAEQSEVRAAAQASDDRSVPEDRRLQEVAAQVVVRVQKVAQEKASALELEEKMVLNIPNADTRVKVTTETENGSEKGGSGQDDAGAGVGVGVEGGDYGSDEDQDWDSEVGLMQATVVCSAELVTPSSRSCRAELNTDPDHPERESSPRGDSQPCPGAAEHCQALPGGAVRAGEEGTTSTGPGTHKEVLTPENTESPASSKTESNPRDGETEEADEKKDKPDDKNERDNSSDTSQLQQFNKNYYDISVVVDDDDDNNDEDDSSSSKTPFSTTAAAAAAAAGGGDNPESKDNHAEESSASSQQPSPRSPPSSSSHCEEPGTLSTSSQPQKEVSQPLQSLPENGDRRRPAKEKGQEGSAMVEVSVRCNGSHVLKAEKAEKEEKEEKEEEKEEEKAEDSCIDALLKLHSGVNGEKQVVLETVERNNNVSVEVEKSATDHGETTATADTNDSRD